MVSKDLTFNLFGRDVNASASLRKVAATAETTSRDIGRSFGGLPKYAALASAGVIAVSVKMATDFQSQMALLSSAAGEPVAKVKAIGDGVKQIATDTGTPLAQLAEGAYTVAKSFGKDGAAGQLTILRAASEGAAAEHVDLATATDALTSVMKGYNVPAKDAVKVQNELIAASGLSKTTMQDFAGSLSSVVPLASALHVSFAEVGGAIATMTQHGETADNATQNLSNLLTNLAGQNNVASQAMQQLGINTVDLQQHLGDRGISGTLDIVEKALAKSSKGGMVVVSSFKQSANATAALNSMLKGMSPQARDLSEHFQKGGLSFKEYGKEMKALGGPAYAQAAQFKGLYLSSQGFNNALKSGNPNISTAATQMQKMLGGVTGMRTALMLGGSSAKGFKGAVEEISKASGKGGKDVSSWGITSKTAAVQFGRLKESLAVVGVAIGSALLPVLTKAASSMAGFFKGVSSGVGAARGIAIAIGVAAAALTGLYLAQKVANLVMFAGRAGLMLFRGALVAWSIATKVAAAAQMAFNLIMDANPVALIILAIVALIAIIVLLVTHWKQVCQVVQVVWGAVCKWFGDTMAAFGAAWAHGWAQIVDGVKAAWKWVSDAVKHGWDQIAGFFSGVGTWLYDTGKNLIQGLLNGAGSILSSIGNFFLNLLPGWIVGPFKAALGIHSPSRVFHGFGVNIGQGLRNGLLGSVDQVKAGAKALSDAVIAQFKNGSIGKGAEEAALTTISRMSTRLQALSKQRATALANLASLKTDRSNMIGNVKNANVDAGNVTSFGSAGDMVNGLRDLVANTRRFKTDLQKLVKMGINRTTFDQLVNAGVMGGGLTAADQLIANPIDFKQIMSLQRQLGGASDSLANYAGGQDYNARIALQSGRAKVLGWEMQKTAASGLNKAARETNVHIHLTGHYAGSKDDLAKTVTTAIRDAVRRGQLPKNILTAL